MKHLLPISKLAGGLCLLAMAISCNNESTTSETVTDSVMTRDSGMGNMENMPLQGHAQADLSGTFPDTTVTGTVMFDTTAGGKVKMVLDISVPKKANKSVAVHIHEHGDCGDTAKMAHGHWNPTNAQHGKWGTGSFHLGDIGNVQLDSKGNGHMEMETDLWTIGGDANKSVLGKAIIVHGGTDDYTSQPSGDAGVRIGCGVIR